MGHSWVNLGGQVLSVHNDVCSRQGLEIVPKKTNLPSQVLTSSSIVARDRGTKYFPCAHDNEKI